MSKKKKKQASESPATAVAVAEAPSEPQPLLERLQSDLDTRTHERDGLQEELERANAQIESLTAEGEEHARRIGQLAEELAQMTDQRDRAGQELREWDNGLKAEEAEELREQLRIAGEEASHARRFSEELDQFSNGLDNEQTIELREQLENTEDRANSLASQLEQRGNTLRTVERQRDARVTRFRCNVESAASAGAVALGLVLWLVFFGSSSEPTEPQPEPVAEAPSETPSEPSEAVTDPEPEPEVTPKPEQAPVTPTPANPPQTVTVTSADGSLTANAVGDKITVKDDSGTVIKTTTVEGTVENMAFLTATDELLVKVADKAPVRVSLKKE